MILSAVTTTLLTGLRIRAAELRVGRQHAGAAVGEGLDWRSPSREQEIEEEHGVADVDVFVPIRVERGDATGLGWSREQPVEGALSVGEVDVSVVVAVAAEEGRSFHMQRPD